MKKLLATVLALSLTIGTFTLPSIETDLTLSDFTITASAEANEGDFKYIELDNGTIEITYYKGDGGDVIIPGTINGKKVTVIGSDSFYNCGELTDVTIPEGVTSIGSCAFYNCRNLTNILIPNGVISIGYNAFDNCTSLTKVAIPNSVTRIKYDAFANCTNLSSITLPNNINKIENGLFRSCKNLTNVIIPESVIDIGYSSFKNCSCLENIVIPKNVTNIGDNAFSSCSSLKNITIPSNITKINQGVFYNCDRLESVTMPDNITTIDACAFYKCTSLKDAIIPNGVTYIGDHAFEDCAKLDNIIIPNSVTSIGSYAFYGCTGTTGLKLSINISEIGDYAFGFYGRTYYDQYDYDYSYNHINNFKLEVYPNMDGEEYAKKFNIPYGLHYEHEHRYAISYTTHKSCTSGAKKIFTCEYCGYSYTETIPATGHKSSGWIVDKNAAINVKGSKHKECTVCKTVLETADIPALPMINIQSANVSVSTNSYVFDNTAKKPSVTVKIGGKALKNGSDYTVSYLNNTKVGTATVRITGKGDYTGTITRNFTINPVKQQIQKLETRYKGFFVDWAQKGSATGYEVQYATNSNFTGAKRATITNNKTDKTTVSKLSANKKYYVRVRSYTNVNGKVYYGAWSDVKSIKTANNDITKATVSGISTKAFTGKAITQNVTVKVGNTVLKNGTDYTVSYSNNKKVGKAIVKITGKGILCGLGAERLCYGI